LISGLIGSTAKYLKIDRKKLIGIGIGTVGPLNRASGVMINPANFEAPGWSNVPFKAMLAEKTGLPVIIDNGANAAVLAETLFGAGKGLKDVVYLNCGIGIRTGVISSGTIVRTINDAEDAFGHMVIDVDGETCICGNSGCIETYSSIGQEKLLGAKVLIVGTGGLGAPAAMYLAAAGIGTIGLVDLIA